MDEDQLIEEFMKMEEEEVMTPSDDYVLSAQDAFFANDLDNAIMFCEKALKLNPRDTDAYDMLCEALLRRKDFKKTFEIAVQWGKKSKESVRQLNTIVQSGYYVDGDLKVIIDAAKRIARSRDEMANGSLGAALLADFEDQTALKASREIADKFFVDQYDSQEAAAANALLVWIDLKTKLDQVNESIQRMKNLISKQTPNNNNNNKSENNSQKQEGKEFDAEEEMLRALPIVAPQNQHLALSLLAIHLLSDQNQIQQANDLFSDYLKSLSLDSNSETALYAHPNLYAIQVLLAAKREPSSSKTLTHNPWVNETHPIVRKRLFTLINNNNNNNNKQ